MCCTDMRKVHMRKPSAGTPCSNVQYFNIFKAMLPVWHGDVHWRGMFNSSFTSQDHMDL